MSVAPEASQAVGAQIAEQRDSKRLRGSSHQLEIAGLEWLYTVSRDHSWLLVAWAVLDLALLTFVVGCLRKFRGQSLGCPAGAEGAAPLLLALEADKVRREEPEQACHTGTPPQRAHREPEAAVAQPPEKPRDESIGVDEESATAAAQPQEKPVAESNGVDEERMAVMQPPEEPLAAESQTPQEESAAELEAQRAQEELEEAMQLVREMEARKQECEGPAQAAECEARQPVPQPSGVRGVKASADVCPAPSSEFMLALKRRRQQVDEQGSHFEHVPVGRAAHFAWDVPVSA